MDPVADVTDVYRCFVCEPDGSEQTVIDLVRRPHPVPEERRDVVDFDVVYMRNVAFESEATGRRIELPYLIGRTLTVYSPPSENLLKLEGPTLWAVLGGLAVITGFILWRMSRQTQRRRRHPALAGKEGVGMRALFEMRMREDAAKRAAGASEQKPRNP